MQDGTPFGRYRLLDLVGRGGMGEVWRAYDTGTERIVAVKVLPSEYAGDAVFEERFRREARSAAALDEPHVVPIYDFGEIDGRLFVTMRLIRGRDLQSLLGQEAITPQQGGDGSPVASVGAAAYSETWQLRSACGANGCIASASTGRQYPAKQVVFDKVGGHWLAVTTSRGKCNNRDDDEHWDAISVQQQPDGPPTGDWTTATANSCFAKRAIAFTRTQDTDIALLPDPGARAARVLSPAEALHGSYDQQTKYANGGTRDYRLGVRTDCLRTGDRCMSLFLEPKAVEPFVYADGAWTRNNEYDTSCSPGGTVHIKNTATLPLPQPPQNPITVLTGQGFMDSGGGTNCGDIHHEVTFTRTGD